MIRDRVNRLKGFAIPLVVIAILVLFVTCLAFLHLGFERRVFSIRTGEGIAARCAADAGLQRAIFDLNKVLKSNDYKNIPDDKLPCASNVGLDGSNEDYSYKVMPLGLESKVIESTGKSHEAERTVYAQVQLRNPFGYGVFADEKLILYNGSVVDWYNYDADDKPMKVGTNSTKNAAVDLKNFVTVKGDVVVGPGGDPSKVVNLGSGVNITGGIYSLLSKTQLDSVEVPSWLETMPSSGTLQNDATITTSGRYDKINLGNSEKLKIEGDVKIYVSGDIILGNNSSIEVSNVGGDSSLVIYLGGNLECKYGSNINNLTEIPKNFRLLALDSCEKIVLKNSADFYGVVYGPRADVILDNSADLYGSITADTIDLKNAVNVYYDASLRDLRDQDSVLRFSLSRWEED
jgi:hypothetical protein